VIDWSRLGTLTFEPPDTEAFPCLALAYAAARTGGGTPTVLNAANEVAVAAFLDGRLAWRGIAEVVAEVTAAHAPGNLETVEDVTEADAWARARARMSVERRSAA
jgi:1-deoxy-D-xylulose-5-phosphate reductoisomerase